MLYVRVSQFEDVKNQFEITTSEGRYFQSYNSVIIFIDKKGQVFLDERFYNYSHTTVKFRNRFLGVDTKTVNDRINSGMYKLVDLNK